MDNRKNFFDARRATNEERLLRQIASAQAVGNWALAAKLMNEHQQLIERESNEVRYTLQERCIDADDKKRLTEHVITILILCDLAYKHAVEFGDMLSRQYDLHNLDLIEGVTHATEELKRLVCTVDVFGDEALGRHYADMVDEVELRGELPLMNTIRTIMQKRINYL